MYIFKSYSFSRLINHNELEFYWISGLTHPDNFDEHWDGRGHESVGYLVMYKNHEERKLKNFIYLIKDKAKDKEHAKRYIHRFAISMVSVNLGSYDIEFILNETTIYQPVVKDSEFIGYIERITKNDIPITLLNKIKI